MSFKLATYIKPDFSEQRFVDAPDATLVKAPCDKAARTDSMQLRFFRNILR